MLSLRIARARRRVRPVADVISGTSTHVRAEEQARVAATVQKARESLRPFAELPAFTGRTALAGGNAGKLYQHLGGVDGVGALLRLATFDEDADGTISAAELSRFKSEGEVLVDSLQSAALNCACFASLERAL